MDVDFNGFIVVLFDIWLSVRHDGNVWNQGMNQKMSFKEYMIPSPKYLLRICPGT